VALALVFSSRNNDWIVTVFPLWVLLLSVYILIDNLQAEGQ